MQKPQVVSLQAGQWNRGASALETSESDDCSLLFNIDSSQQVDLQNALPDFREKKSFELELAFLIPLMFPFAVGGLNQMSLKFLRKMPSKLVMAQFSSSELEGFSEAYLNVLDAIAERDLSYLE